MNIQSVGNFVLGFGAAVMFLTAALLGHADRELRSANPSIEPTFADVFVFYDVKHGPVAPRPVR